METEWCPPDCSFCATDKERREQEFQNWLAKLEQRDRLTRRDS